MRYDGPFTVRWLDGREETIDIPYLSEHDLRAAWGRHRERGAIGLIDALGCQRDHDYTEAALAEAGLGPGARVRHTCSHLTGTVKGYEYHASGRLSALPLKVYWDQESPWTIYPAPESLMAVTRGEP